jgi:hypothetical protein
MTSKTMAAAAAAAGMSERTAREVDKCLPGVVYPVVY